MQGALAAKPEAEIWRRPVFLTQRLRLLIQLRIHYGVYLTPLRLHQGRILTLAHCSLIYPKIQQRQVIMNVLHPSCARPPRWSTPVLGRRFEDGMVSVCVLIHSCMMPNDAGMDLCNK